MQPLKYYIMGLIYCPDCGKGISESAFQCPNCAYPLNILRGNLLTKSNRNTEIIVAGYIVAFLSLFLLPILLMIIDIVLGIINTIKGAVGHGILQILFSLLFGILGTFLSFLSYL